jgi:tRNA nucleotidyltransferase/poly(A) polymerase
MAAYTALVAASAREVALEIIRVLRGGGHVAYLAGGCVRDEILGHEAQDYDVATDATPDRIASLFKRTRAVGKAFGVMQVQDRGVTVEVATFRKEHGYSDRRRPDSVTFSSAEEDARRRDFTINALLIDPLAPPQVVRGVRVAGAVIDFVGGLADLERRVIRAVGDPDERLAEDNLRALRAVRFAARLGFTIDPSTAEAIRRHAADLAGVSRERIGEEVRRMLSEPSRASAAGLIESLGLDASVLRESARGGGSLSVLGTLRGCTAVTTALAAWAVDRAGPDLPIAETVARWRRALCLSNDEADGLRALLGGVRSLRHEWPGLSVAGRKRGAASPWFGEARRLIAGFDAAASERVTLEATALARSPGGLAPTPLVTGDDLVAAGIAPGKGFGQWLDAVYDAQLEGRIETRDEALDLARRLAEAG